MEHTIFYLGQTKFKLRDGRFINTQVISLKRPTKKCWMIYVPGADRRHRATGEKKKY